MAPALDNVNDEKRDRFGFHDVEKQGPFGGHEGKQGDERIGVKVVSVGDGHGDLANNYCGAGLKLGHQGGVVGGIVRQRSGAQDGGEKVTPGGGIAQGDAGGGNVALHEAGGHGLVGEVLGHDGGEG
ncbi:hypothetical protein FGB62_120g130 [Gracilaria domingensis]|nr:hypothetical protein FGB62_120g130 [Gracilaria domingensis]